MAKTLNCMCLVNRLVFGRQRVGTLGTWGLAHTGLISVEWLLRAAAALPEGTTEIMTHPGRPEGLEPDMTRLIESRRAEMAALCSPAVKDAFRASGVELIHYGHLRGQ
jgi:predicted glycoside hydrolase/deacetylase ChbG (UPF0249 family)